MNIEPTNLLNTPSRTTVRPERIDMRMFMFPVPLVFLASAAQSALAEFGFDKDISWRWHHFDTLPATIVNRVKGYVDFPADADASPLWQ